MSKILDSFTGAPSLGDVICRVKDIKEGMALELTYQNSDDLLDIFILRKEGEIYAYKNTCPHAGTPLNMMPEKFMERTETYLMCHTHGALFNYSTGECVGGPCKGSYLTPISIQIKEGLVLAA